MEGEDTQYDKKTSSSSDILATVSVLPSHSQHETSSMIDSHTSCPPTFKCENSTSGLAISLFKVNCETSSPNEEDSSLTVQSENSSANNDKSCNGANNNEMEKQEEARPGLRSRSRKRVLSDPATVCCPVCGVTLRQGEIQSHLVVEQTKLNKIFRNSRKSLYRENINPGSSKKVVVQHINSRKGRDCDSSDAQTEARYDSYLRVKAARQTRLRALAQKKRYSPGETSCPVCNERLVGTPEELNEHVNQCLKKPGESDEDGEVDIEANVDEEEYEEYTWAGQTRVRATSMLPGGLAASGFITTTQTSSDEDIDLDVDGDDSQKYGQPQYSEADLIPMCISDEPKEEQERIALRGACLEAEGCAHSSNTETSRTRWSVFESEDSAFEGSSPAPTSHVTEDLAVKQENLDRISPSIGHGSAEEIIESLKAKIREQQEQLKKKEQYKCLICMERYHQPLTSIQCWHVHCEECWLCTLGVKKLCPQCNMITSPADLRKIYL